MPGSTPASATADVPVVGAPAVVPRTGLARRLVRRPTGVLGIALTLLVVLVGVFAEPLAPHDPFRPIGPPLGPPSRAHPMGTDSLGRDLLSGVIFGARTSLLVAAGVGVVALALGALIGGTAGYRAGRVDDVLMRLTEAFQTLPRFFLAIVVVAIFGPGVDRLILVLGLTAWAVLARVIRAEVLYLREQEFVVAATALGGSDRRTLWREILPNTLPITLSYLGLLLAQVILLEASLGFLGLGDPDAISWGYLAGQAQRFLRVAWWLSVFPGLAIMVAVLGLNLLADALSDALGGR